MESGAEIDYTPTVAASQLFENASYTTSIVDMQDLTFDNNASAAGCYLSAS